MKPVLTHLGKGLATLFCAGLVIIVWEWALLEWVQRKELAAAFWLTLADVELMVASVLFFLLWFITLFRGKEHYGRFRGCVAGYCYCVAIVIVGGLFPTGIGVAAIWLYSVNWWPIAAVLRLFEVGLCIALLASVGIWTFVMATHPFSSLDSKDPEPVNGNDSPERGP